MQGRTCLGFFWFLTALISSAGVLLSLLGFLINSFVEGLLSCDDGNTATTTSPDCDDEVTNIGRYLSIATAVVCAIVAICAVVLCCFGCCFQEVDEGQWSGSWNIILNTHLIHQ